MPAFRRYNWEQYILAQFETVATISIRGIAQ